MLAVWAHHFPALLTEVVSLRWFLSITLFFYFYLFIYLFFFFFLGGGGGGRGARACITTAVLGNVMVAVIESCAAIGWRFISAK